MMTLNDIKTEYIDRSDGDAIVVNALLALLDECQPYVQEHLDNLAEDGVTMPVAIEYPEKLLAILNSDKPLEVE